MPACRAGGSLLVQVMNQFDGRLGPDSDSLGLRRPKALSFCLSLGELTTTLGVFGGIDSGLQKQAELRTAGST